MGHDVKHAREHTVGDDQIDEATITNSGFMSASDKTKLDGIADGADVTGSNEAGSVEGTNVKSTGETGGTKVLTEDGSGGASWQAPTGGTDPDAIHDNVSGEINAITSKATPVDADVMVIEDSAATYAKKKVAMSALKSFAQTGIEGTAILSTSETEGLALITQGNNTADWQKVKMTELDSQAALAGAIPAANGSGGTAVAIRYAESMERVLPMGVTFGSNLSGYFLWGRADTYTTNEANAQVRMRKSKVVAISGNVSAYSGTVTMTVRKNGVATAITCTISATGQQTVTGDVDFADGDLISVAFSVGPGGSLTCYGIHITIRTEVV